MVAARPPRPLPPATVVRKLNELYKASVVSCQGLSLRLQRFFLDKQRLLDRIQSVTAEKLIFSHAVQTVGGNGRWDLGGGGYSGGRGGVVYSLLDLRLRCDSCHPTASADSGALQAQLRVGSPPCSTARAPWPTGIPGHSPRVPPLGSRRPGLQAQ